MFGKEPAVVFGGIATLIGLVIPALIIFEIIHWDDKQIAAIMGIVSFSANFLAVLLTRSQVVPTQVANTQIQTAIDSPAGSLTVPQVIAKTAEDDAARNATQ